MFIQLNGMPLSNYDCFMYTFNFVDLPVIYEDETNDANIDDEIDTGKDSFTYFGLFMMTWVLIDF